jgi:hypothetical protein
VETQEERHRLRLDDDVIPEIVHAIRARYDLTLEAEEQPLTAARSSQGGAEPGENGDENRRSV